MVVGIHYIDSRQLVAVPFENSLDSQPAYLQGELRVFQEKVARCAAERARIGAARVGKFKGEIAKAGLFRGGKPPAGLTARCGQIRKDVLRVAAGYFLTIVRNVARPVEELFAVRAYLSYASSTRPTSSRTFSHAASMAASG